MLDGPTRSPGLEIGGGCGGDLPFWIDSRVRRVDVVDPDSSTGRASYSPSPAIYEYERRLRGMGHPDRPPVFRFHIQRIEDWLRVGHRFEAVARCRSSEVVVDPRTVAVLAFSLSQIASSQQTVSDLLRHLLHDAGVRVVAILAHDHLSTDTGVSPPRGRRGTDRRPCQTDGTACRVAWCAPRAATNAHVHTLLAWTCWASVAVPLHRAERRVEHPGGVRTTIRLAIVDRPRAPAWRTVSTSTRSPCAC